MRIAFIAPCLACATGSAWAQAGNDDKLSDKSGYNSGRIVTPETWGEKQSQGWTGGPITTGKGGAPAASPQGQTPPGMQSAPGGSSTTTVESAKSDEK